MRKILNPKLTAESPDGAKWHQIGCFLKSQGAMQKYLAPKFLRHQFGAFHFWDNFAIIYTYKYEIPSACLSACVFASYSRPQVQPQVYFFGIGTFTEVLGAFVVFEC